MALRPLVVVVTEADDVGAEPEPGVGAGAVGSGEERGGDVDVRPGPSFSECVVEEISAAVSCGEEAEPAIFRFLMEAVMMGSSLPGADESSGAVTKRKR